MKSAHRTNTPNPKPRIQAKALSAPLNRSPLDPARTWSMLVAVLVACLILSGCAVTSFKEPVSYSKAHKFPPELVPSLIQAAGDGTSGDPDAQFKLSHAYAKGIGVDRNTKEALYWLQQSARQEYPHAMFKMGILYAKGGMGLKQDTRKSILWFRRAARYDQPNALMTLAHLRFRGKHLRQDYNRAQNYYCRAADTGEVNGMFYCGLLNTHPKFAGKVETQDLDYGLGNLEKAAEQGNQRAMKLLPLVRPPEATPQEDAMSEEDRLLSEEISEDDEGFL